MSLTLAHWLYGVVTVVVILTMIFRRGVVLPTLVGTFLVGWVYQGSFVGGLTSIFNANLVAAQELFNIFLIITLMVALLNSMKDLGSDQRMIYPIQKIMVNGHVSFLLLIVVTYVISLFFWPTPAVPLICALLVPAAIRVGLTAMGAAMAVSLAGQGMALSSDYIIQVAPMLSATSAGIDISLITDKALILSLITGLTAIAIVYVLIRKQIRRPGSPEIAQELAVLPGKQNDQTDEVAATNERETTDLNMTKWANVFAVLVPLAMLGIMLFMISTKISGEGGLEGGDGAAFVGGVAVILLILASIAFGRMKSLDRISEHIVEGFTFAFRAMGPVIPIAGFFFLGSDEFTGRILSLGEEADKPAFLFDLVQSGQTLIPESPFFTAFGILIIGIITGLDGSGFSGLPLTGALSGAMAGDVGMDPGTLAAIGQVGTIFTGGGTIVAWSSLVAVAGFCGVSPLELARKNLVPVMIGLIVATVLAVLIW